MLKLSVITVLITLLLIFLLLAGVIAVDKYIVALLLFTSLESPLLDIRKNLKEKINN